MSACHGRCTGFFQATPASRPRSVGGGGEKNGNLIRLAEAEFDLFITADQNSRYQQNLSGRRIAIMELSTNDLRRILTAAADINQAFKESNPVII